MNATNILLRNNFIPVPKGNAANFSMSTIATVAMNLSYYGYSVDAAGMRAIMALNEDHLEDWWAAIEPELKNITGDDRNMADFVVYKNFPAEVLEKSQAEYWFNQILMYWGLPNELFTQEVQPREGMKEAPQVTVLRKSSPEALKGILNGLVAQTARWNDQAQADALYLSATLVLNWSKFGFKENMVAMATAFIKEGKTVNVSTGTDVLRLAAGLSDGDVSLREKFKFAKFGRKTRRFLLAALEGCSNLFEDAARRPEMWKRFLKCLHPYDYKARYPQVALLADAVYKNNLTTFNSLVEGALDAKEPEALELLATRPGEFRRRLVHCLDLFGAKAVETFCSHRVLSKLTVAQLVTTRRFIESAVGRVTRVFPPRGNWTKLKIAEARPVKAAHAEAISAAIGAILSERVPTVKHLDAMCENIKLPSNDGEVGYNRGTVFTIPDNVDFVRSASYWSHKSFGNTWFDNGWNLFDENWKPVATCCWSRPNQKVLEGAAAFSGDPTNTKDVEGRACQLIDLQLDALARQGVRYAVWNVLCYSDIPFSQADEVYAALQWGEDAQSGKLFEPSRCQLSFPLTGESKTKFVCFIDLQSREMTYMDANLKGEVHTAKSNEATLSEQMPAFVEYLNALPSVADLFRESVDKERGVGYVVYSDKDVEIKSTEDKPETAYVFRPENEANSYTELNINELLS